MANIKCIGKFTNLAVFNELGKQFRIGTQIYKAVANVFDGENFTKDFIDYYKKIHKKEPIIDKDSKQLAKAIIDFNNLNFKNVSNTSINKNQANSKVSRFGYKSFAVRRKGIKKAAKSILNAYKYAKESNQRIIGNPIDYYWHCMKVNHTNHVLQLCADLTGRTFNDIKKEFIEIPILEHEKRVAYLDKILNKNNIADIYKNSFALWREMNGPGNVQEELKQEIFNEKDLVDVLADDQSEEDKAEEYAKDNGAETNELTTETEQLVGDVELDYYIGKVTNEQGKFSNYLKHSSARIRTYLNTLPRLTSVTKINGQFSPIRDTDYGLVETMSVEECMDQLFSGNDNFNSPETMVDYIQLVAETIPGFESFAKFAEDLRNDYDFAAEVFRNFSKVSMDRLQVIHDNGTSKVKLATERSSKKNAMFFNMLNDIKSGIQGFMKDASLQKHTEILGLISEAEHNIRQIDNKYRKRLEGVTTEEENVKAYEQLADKNINNIKSEIITLIRSLFPSVEPKAIEAYINLANGAIGNRTKQIENTKDLLNKTKKIIEAGEASKNAWYNRQTKIKEYAAHNYQLEQEAQEGKWVDNRDYLDIKTVFASDYLTSTHKNAISELRDLLVSYSVVPTQKNVPNVIGNQSSVIINNSYITDLKNIFSASTTEIVERNGKRFTRTRNKILEDWGKEKARDHQLRSSSILFEQRDRYGHVITPGIFRIETHTTPDGETLEEVILTEEGPELLKIYMLDGATDMDTGSNMTYDKMVFGDFCPTSFIQFFGTEQNSKLSTKIATYFPRIPSDATTLYSIQAPRYDTSDLFEDADPFYRNKVANEIVDPIPVISGQEFSALVKDSDDAPIGELADVTTLITKGFARFHKDSNAINIFKKQDGSQIAVISYLEDEPNGIGSGVYYQLSGDVREEGNELVVNNIQLRGIGGRQESDIVFAKDSLKAAIMSKLDKDFTYGNKTYAAVKQKVNRNSQVFNIIRNQFKQEMLGTAIAVDHYFDTDDTGFILDGDPEVDVKVIKIKDGLNNKIGYSHYHLGTKSKEVLTRNSNGTYNLEGNAFHSRKFTITVEEIDEFGNIKLVPKNFLDEVISMDMNESDENGNPIDDGKIHILYGGGNADSHLHVLKNKDGEVIEVYFTESQQELIDQKLEEWVQAYVAKAETLIQSNAQFIKGIEVNSRNIVEFAMNNAIFLMNSDDLLDGDTGFYKDVQTVLKRAKQYEGSGMLYSVVDRESDTNPKMSYLNEGTYKKAVRDENGKIRKDDKGNVIFEDIPIQKIFQGYPNSPLANCQAKKTFKAVTIYNTQLTNRETLDPLVKELAKILPGKTQEEKENAAKDLIYGKIKYKKNGEIDYDDETNQPKREGGYSETKVNDAQSYITMAEWVRRIAARGQLKRYMPLIEKLLDENTVLTAADIKEFVQVQKNFYYDQWYDPRYKKYVPRQIKNAEFVLVPRLIKGTQLEKVHELMIEAGIDQLNTLETSKAANEEIITLWDNKGELTGADTFVENAKRLAQEYNYRYLYTQQETPQHMNSTNKIGIQIDKKIIDNIPEGHPLYHKKIEYMNLLVRNIRDSYENLLREFGVETDDQGNIIYNANGTFNIDLTSLYSKLKQEMRRLGVDENLMDYVTLDENGAPLMPPIVNMVLSKVESVFQSMFNNSITRQRLPGFHAAQVTNIGWKALGEQVKGVTYNKNLRYRPVVNRKVQDYIEVMLPASMFGIDKTSEHYSKMTDEEIVKELKDKGLDIVMGYRIPTEGKQSVCNMKIVGLLDDSYGSTIIVPNEWVAQTGSDFDIDSVYGINYETYKNSTGEIFKIQYLDKNNLPTIYDYYNFINDARKALGIKKVEKSILNVKEDIDNAISELNGKSVRAETYKEMQKASKEAFEVLPEVVKKKLNSDRAKVNKLYEYAKSGAVLLEKIKVNKKTLKRLIKLNNDKTDLVVKLERYLDILEALENCITFSNAKSKIIEKYLKERKENLEKEADELGLPSFDKFVEMAKNSDTAIDINSRQARNNRILDNMKDILGDITSMEENLSRSNFEDIIYWRNKLINKNNQIERANRSPYDPFDQMRFQEDAISGTHLKGISVSLDTFCSVCNTVRPTLTSPIKVVYDSNDIIDVNNWNHKKGKNNTVLVTHDTYGWSNSKNRNIVGKLLTVYSSETTAHILDAVKEGAIPGVNVYTFPAYKTLLNVGSDYKTAISFIMQPGIKRIIDNYNANNSVFGRNYDNPINQTIIEIAEELGVMVKPGTPITAVLATLNTKYKTEFNSIFRQQREDELSITFQSASNIPLIVPKLVDRLQDKSYKNETEKLLFDLGVVLSFYHLNKVAKECQSIAMCCNPDKFGAKQTIYATRKVFDDIHHQIWKYKLDGTRSKNTGILQVGDTHILEAIYPGAASEEATVDNPAIGIIKANPKDSKYRTLMAYLKYSSALSVILAEKVFPTQHNNFVDAVRGFANVLTYRNRLTESQYKDIERYILSHFYYSAPAVINPVMFDLDDSNNHIKLVIEDSENPNAQTNLQQKERLRIFGFGHTSSFEIPIRETIKDETGKVVKDENGKDKTKINFIPFEVENFHKPTKEELTLYIQLSPAQKVKWLEEQLDDPEIFSLYKVQLDNGKERGRLAGVQTITYVENSIDPNAVLNMFKSAFINENPLIKLAAIDLVKYAVIVEGLNIGNNNVTKSIPNAVINGERSDDSMGIIDHVLDKLYDIGQRGNDLSDPKVRSQIYEDYLRSHPDTEGVKKLYLSKRNKEKFHIATSGYGTYGTIFIPIEYTTVDGVITEDKSEFEERMSKAGVLKKIDSVTGTSYYEPNQYIRIISGKENYLYKINKVSDGYILYPLNPLEVNEHGTWSAKQSNNRKYPDKYIYEAFINAYDKAKEEAAAETTFNGEFVNQIVLVLKKDKDWAKHWYKQQYIYNRNQAAEDFDLMDEAKDGIQGTAELLDAIQEHFSKPSVNNLFVFSPTLTDRIIHSYGPEYGTIQHIKLKSGAEIDVLIQKLPKQYAKSLEKLFLKKVNKKYELPDNEFYNLVNQISNIQIREAVIHARKLELTTLENTYEVSKFTPPSEAMYSSVEELSVDALDFVNVDFMQNNKHAIELIGKFKKYGIKNDQESLKNNSVSIHRELAAYATKKGQELIARFNYFSGNKSILDDSIQNELANDEVKVNKYLQLLNEIKAFVDNFSPYVSFDVESEDTELQFLINKIKEAVEPITKLDTNTAAHKFAQGYLKSLSSNQLLVDNIIKIFDNYWKSTGAMWAMHDIMENGTPLLQIIGKDIMGNIEAKRIATERNIRAFEDDFDGLIREAQEAGLDIDFDKIVDKRGILRQNYKEEFATTLKQLSDDVKIKSAEHGVGSVEHLRAKWKYDIFKAKFLNQEAKPAYYLNRCNLEFNILNEHPEVYSCYMTAFYARQQLFDLAKTYSLSEDQEKELRLHENVIYILTGQAYELDNQLYEGIITNEEKSQAENIVREAIESSEDGSSPTKFMEAVSALNDFRENLKDLNDEYFEYVPVFGFEELLQKHLKTISDYENRDANGIPQTPAAQLNTNPKYREAKQWIRENARFDFNPKYDQNHQPMNIGAVIQRALRTLSRNSKGKTIQVRKYIAELEEQKGIQIIDEYGVIDATKLDDIELNIVKSLTNNTNIKVTFDPYNTGDLGAAKISGASDRILISSTPKNDVIYSPEFYNKISRRGNRGPLTLAEVEERRRNGDPDLQYHETVLELNKLLMPYYVEGVVHLERIPMTTEGVNILRNIAKCYTKLKNIERAVELTDEEEQARKDFIRDNVEFDTTGSESIVRNQQLAIQSLVPEGSTQEEKDRIKQEWEEAWMYVTFERKADGTFAYNENGEYVLNSQLYATMKPKGDPTQWIDERYNEAIKTMQRYFKKYPSKYYQDAQHQAMLRNQTEPGYYDEWFVKNHTYNVETGQVEPIDVWLESIVDYDRVREDDMLLNSGIPGYETKMKWVARPTQSERKVKDGNTNRGYIQAYDKRNPDYDPNIALANNYSGINYATEETDTEWKNNIELNEYETRMRDFIQNTLIESVDNEKEKYRFKEGKLPWESKETGNISKRVAKETGKIFGLVLDKKKSTRTKKEEVGFDHDVIPPLPMSRELFSKDAGSQTFDVPEPKPEDFTTPANPMQGIDEHFDEVAYNEAHQNWENAKKEVEENNKKVHEAILNRDWKNVISNYLLKQGQRRATQNEKQKLYYTLNMLKQQKAYIQEHSLSGNLKQDDSGYISSVDDKLIEVFKTFIRRMLNDDYKDDDSSLTRFANRLQQFTSADYMMMNIKGGISNVTLGFTGMLAEAAAGEFIDGKSLRFGLGELNMNIVSYFRGIYETRSYSKADAVIKLFNVVEYDDIKGISTETNIEKYAERLRNAMFSPQTMGEFFMQNSVLFAMLHSHKIIELNEPIKGINQTFMNEGEYIRYREAQELVNLLTEEQREKLAKFKKDIAKDAQDVTDYAWWKKDIITQFLIEHCNKQQREEFAKKREEKSNEYKAEFAEKEDMYSQIELGDKGYASFVAGSKLEELSRQPALDGKVTAADVLCGQFSERVRKVNNKIHGVYNKRGRAYIENKWWGSLFMQYHKHLPFGLLKRYRKRGYYNETRGTVEKGMLASIGTLLSVNVQTLKKDNGWTEDETNTVQSVLNLLGHSFEYLVNIKHSWKIIPEYDKANIRRNVGDLVGVLVGVMGVIALMTFGDDDDEEGVPHALMLYEFDRLASEAFLYNPIGLWTESKTLMSTPIAGESIVDDGISAIENTLEWMFGGEDYDGLYHSGQFAGRHRLSVYLERRTPIWNGIRSIRDLPKNNRYFKRGEKVTTIFPTKTIAKKNKEVLGIK